MPNHIGKTNAGGRLEDYTIEHVRVAVEKMLAGGQSADEIDARAVRTMMCSMHGVSSGIREESLKPAVAHVLGSARRMSAPSF